MDAAVAHVVGADPAFARVVAAVGPFSPRPPQADAFNALARAIVYQQLAGRAAQAIHGRFLALFDGHATAGAVLATPYEQLRAVGLSNAKALALLDLAAKRRWDGAARPARRAARRGDRRPPERGARDRPLDG